MSLPDEPPIGKMHVIGYQCGMTPDYIGFKKDDLDRAKTVLVRAPDYLVRFYEVGTRTPEGNLAHFILTYHGREVPEGNNDLNKEGMNKYIYDYLKPLFEPRLEEIIKETGLEKPEPNNGYEDLMYKVFRADFEPQGLVNYVFLNALEDVYWGRGKYGERKTFLMDDVYDLTRQNIETLMKTGRFRIDPLEHLAPKIYSSVNLSEGIFEIERDAVMRYFGLNNKGDWNKDIPGIARALGTTKPKIIKALEMAENKLRADENMIKIRDYMLNINLQNVKIKEK